MNIKNFEQYFDDAVLRRGLDYFRSGNITSLEFDGDEWVAYVEGNYDYTVTVTLSDGGDILDSECNCPFDWGGYCKHQAAVFYAIREELEAGNDATVKTKGKKRLEDVLNDLDKQELLSIIMEIAKRDRRVKESLLLRYEEKTDSIKHARNIIKSTIEAVKHRGYVEYRDTSRATEGADTVLHMIGERINSNDIYDAVSLCIVVLEEMMELIDYCDDSDGIVGNTIYEAIEKIGEAVDSVEETQSNDEQIFDIIFDHALNSVYGGWSDWRMDLLFNVVPLCSSSANRDKIEKYISEQLNVEMGSWSKDYDNKQLQKLQYELMERFDGNSDADAFIKQHLDNSDFRRIAINNALASRQYDEALKLCLDGEDKDSSRAGLVSEWKEFRYAVYEKTNNIEAQKELALELLLKGDFDYFKKLKAFYKSDEWLTVLENILKKLETRDSRGIYVEILINEKLKSRLQEYCRKNPRTITSYYTYLLPEYIKEVGEMFVENIKESAASAGNRSNYRNVCSLIRLYKKACGSVAAYALCDELKAKYIKRPAFLDELGKV